MGFASEYLSARVLFAPFISSRPDRNTAIIIIIPAYNEPEILRTVDSLARCEKPACEVEVLIHVNASGSAGRKELETNKKTINDIRSREEDNSLPFRLHAFDTAKPAIKGWGAGLARKVAMDEAVRRFSLINKPEGIIVSLDADCLVAENYLISLYSDFYKMQERRACSIYFEHPISGNEFGEDVYRAISNYELHLRYYYQGLKYSMFPEVYHTVGSALAVRAETYVRSGGMNRQQAGEDFYFIQKTIPMGGYFYLNNTGVYPSPRLSERVPFGTGPAIKDIVSNNTRGFTSYNPRSFLYLRELFLKVSSLYNAENDKESHDLLADINPDLLVFLEKENWLGRLREIKSNTASSESFEKRFYSWFNMFKVVKYLNWIHKEGSLNKVDVTDAADTLLKLMGMDFKSESVSELLIYYRSLER